MLYRINFFSVLQPYANYATTTVRNETFCDAQAHNFIHTIAS